MNQITVIEYSPDGYQRIDQKNEIDFYRNMESSLFKFFKGNGDVRTFGFILNDNKSNYFQELLTDDDFIQKLNSTLEDELSLIWCEPNSENDNNISKTFEYAGRLKGSSPLKLWNSLLTRISDSNAHPKSPEFPILYILKIQKTERDNKSYYQVKDSFYHSLKNYDEYDNVKIFKKDFLDFLKELRSNLDLIGDSPLTESASKFKQYKDVAKKYAVIEVVKLSVKKTYTSFSEFLGDILENVDITDFFK